MSDYGMGPHPDDVRKREYQTKERARAQELEALKQALKDSAEMLRNEIELRENVEHELRSLRAEARALARRMVGDVGCSCEDCREMYGRALLASTETEPGNE